MKPNKLFIGVTVLFAASLAMSAVCFAMPDWTGQAFPGANGAPFGALSADIESLKAEIEASIATLETEIADLQAQVDANSTDIATLDALSAKQDGLIAALNTVLTLLQDQVEQNTGDIALLEEQNTLQDQLLVVIGDKVNSLNQQVLDNAGDIASLFLLDEAQQMIILTLSETISTLQDQISAGAGDVTALVDEIAILTMRVDQVEIAIQGKQAQLLQACPSGSAIRVINADGSVVCENAGAGVGTLSTLTRNSGSLNATGISTVLCPSTHRATGGGFKVSHTNAFMVRSEPIGNGWRTQSTRGSRAHVVCVQVN